MRRAALSLVLLASSLALGARASADDAPPPAPSASASASAPAPVPAPLPPPSAVPAPLAPVTAAPAAWVPSEEDPLRLLQLLRGEADRQRANRYFGGAVGLVGGTAVAIAGGFMLSAAGTMQDPQRTPYQVYAYVTIGSGALIAISSLFSFFGRTGMERLADAYEPIAQDTSVPAATRLASGEQGLRALASSEHSTRIVSGVTNIVTGIVIGAIGVYFGLNTDLADTDRIVLAGLTGVSAATIIGSGVSSLTWQRGPAEIAMEHWDAARGAPQVAATAARLHVAPLLAPLHGGGAVGLSLTY